MRAKTLLVFGLVGGLWACSDEPGSPPDSGVPGRDAAANPDAAASADAAPTADATTPADAGSHADAAAPGDATIGADAGAVAPGFEHCPAASAYVGDPSWTGRLSTTGELWCAFPRMYVSAADALLQKRRLQLVDGRFGYPLAADDAPFRLPACLESTGGAAAPEVLAGTISAETREDFGSGMQRTFIDAVMPLSGGAGELRFGLVTAPGVTDVDFSGPADRIEDTSAALCHSANCREPGDLLFYPCEMRSNICDEITLMGGSLTIDQHHWAGQVGSGFAAGVRVRGTLDGTAFDITAYRQIQVTYGHHAFSRGVVVLFDAPIGTTCGIEVEEIAESTTSTSAHLLDCAGQRIGTRPITASDHKWQQPCDP